MQNKDQIIKREKMFAFIEQWQQSDYSQRQFCIEHNIPYHIFIYYHKKYKQQFEEEKAGFLPMEITSASFQTASSQIEVHYPNGVVVRLPSSMDLKMVEHLIKI